MGEGVVISADGNIVVCGSRYASGTYSYGGKVTQTLAQPDSDEAKLVIHFWLLAAIIAWFFIL